VLATGLLLAAGVLVATPCLRASFNGGAARAEDWNADHDALYQRESVAISYEILASLAADRPLHQ